MPLPMRWEMPLKQRPPIRNSGHDGRKWRRRLLIPLKACVQWTSELQAAILEGGLFFCA